MGGVFSQPGDREAAGAVAGMGEVYGRVARVGERVSFRPQGVEDAYEVGTVRYLLDQPPRHAVVEVEGTGVSMLVPLSRILPF